jgi:hypothetical protein
MNISQIESKLQKLIKRFNQEEFIYDFLLAYGSPKSAVTLLKKGNRNMSKNKGEVVWKKKMFFKEEFNEDIHVTILTINATLKHDERFVILTDYKTLLAVDTKTQDKLDIPLSELPKHYAFFLPLAGMEKAQHQDENPADIKAAVKMAKLFDEIKKDNPDESPEFIHGLNVFLSRLLFCFFAEDTHIFEDNQFTNAIDSHTQTDGSDLNSYLDTLFEVLNTPENKRKNLPQYLNDFPYVNGGLFDTNYNAPTFSSSSRRAVIASGGEDWAEINPDIFGSMFQAVISVDQRGSLGQHYTSVPNIMKVIEPLFLNDLYEEFENAKGNEKKLNELLFRLKNIKIFDPACGSGNFLIIAYKELRKLEMAIFKESGSMALSEISLAQFYGIELDDFAHEIAKLALWLVEHQMNVEFFKEFGKTNPTLPLKDAGHIVQGNACRLDWEKVCPKGKDDETYILGNPPYLGARMQEPIQKEDLDIVFHTFSNYRDLDYIACWFYKGGKYVQKSNVKLAFVSTNSICQGMQVSLLWPKVFEMDIEINFAHTSFKWQNSAKENAAVIVVIIGLSNRDILPKTLFTGNLEKKVKIINAYLAYGSSPIVLKRSDAISFPFEMPKGNMPYDGGKLILEKEDHDYLIKTYPESEKFIRKLVGSKEFINGIDRWCLWIKNSQFEEAISNPFIFDRVNKVKEIRLSSTDKGAHKLASRSHQFREINETNNMSIIIPSVSSERRDYIPIGFIKSDTIITNLAFAIYDPEIWLFSVLTSKAHMIWMRLFAGRLKNDYRYSSALCYNTFPFPSASKQRKEELTQSAFRIIDERQKYSEKTLAELYDPDKMPEGLREAHRLNDLAVERCYRSAPFTSDEERLEYLFKLYEKMIQEEKEQGTLFATEKKTRKKKR